jgi:DNA-binding MarR family transcriptional regulator
MAARAAVAAGESRIDLPDGGLLGAIVRLNLVVTDQLEGIAGQFGLTFADYLVLGVVRRSPDQQTSPTAIASALDRTKGGVTLALDRLEDAGLLRRSRHRGDGRRVVVELTTQGRRLAVAVNDELHAWEAALELPVSSERAVRLLDQLTAAVVAAAGHATHVG